MSELKGDLYMVSSSFDNLILKCREYSKQMAPKNLHHGFEHCLRVSKYALEIGKRENADLLIVDMSSYLHDIGRGREEKGEYHTITSSRLAASFLRKSGLPEAEIEKVVHSIKSHSRKKPHRNPPQTLEAKVLYDADGLDMIGAVGILRIALSASLRGEGWDYVLKKTRWRLSIIDDFLTASGRSLAKERRKLVSDFLHQLIHELVEIPGH